ncbi:hypothetical protein LTR95_017017 [Oleoguttula sp. CCFEE 5521]
MPSSQLYTVSIPRSSSIDIESKAKPDFKLPLYLQPLKFKPRVYPDTPLPVKPSPTAPRKARITNRISDDGQVKFDIAIGDVKLNDVRLEEVLDYVSPADLEDYETRAFAEEAELLQITREADAQREWEIAERRKERAKRKGEVVWTEVSDVEMGEDGDERGRPRPSYKQAFQVARMRRRRRKRDPVTGELLDLSDGDDGMVVRGPLPQAFKEERQGRRDGKYAVATVELYEKPKRRRRRRHPQTGELMPYGWKYDPKAESAAGAGKGAVMPSMHRLSLSQQLGNDRETKRQRMDLSTSSSMRSKSPVVQLPSSQRLSSSAAHSSPRGDKGKARATSALSSFQQHAAISITDTSEEDDSMDNMPPPSTVKPKSPIMRRSTGGSALNRPPSTSDQSTQFSEDDQPPPVTLTSPVRRQELPGTPVQYMPPLTSIMHPTATSPPSPSATSRSDSDEEDYIIEGISNHALSDPRTHPSDFGKTPIMLYLVKWEGYEEPSWEPESSFGNREVIQAYRRKVGMPPLA